MFGASLVAGLLVALAATAPRWTRLLTRTVPGEEAEETRAEGGAEEPEVGRQITVKLFFQAADRPGFVMEERAVAYSADLAQQLETVVRELAAGSRTGLGATLPKETKVQEVFVTSRGIAYVDLSREVAAIPGGSESELMTVYSIVNTLAINFPAVRRVQLLIDERPSPTLAGHVNIQRPLPPDMTLMAASTLQPLSSGGGGAASPSPSPSPS